jgi:hypothetical protein
MGVGLILRLTCYGKLFTLAICDAVRREIDSKLLQQEGATEMKRDLWRSMSDLALPISAWITHLLVKRRQRTGKGLWDRGTVPVRRVHCDNIVICAWSAHVAILNRFYRLTVPISIDLHAWVGGRKERRDRQQVGEDGSYDDKRVG